MATRIGVDKLHYAKMTTEDTPTAAPVYGDPVPAPGVMSLNINPNGTLETLFADDGPYESASTTGQIEVEIQKNQLKSSEKADLLGHTIDEDGGIVYGENDVPPYVAILFRTLRSNGKYRYVTLYKGKFIDPEDNNETKGDGINFQSETISGRFLKLQKSYKLSATKETTPWKYELDEEDDDASTTKIAAWFTAVQFPKEYSAG